MVVVLHLIVWDANKGVMLEEFKRQMPSYAYPDLCLSATLSEAKRLTAKWRSKGFSNAFTNVDCEWRRGQPMDPA